ncbi:MAG: hypothetical protein ACREEK_33805, partial [Bradyrhizobium sp.]
MADVIELGSFAGIARLPAGTVSASVQPSKDERWSRSTDFSNSNDFLSAAAVRKLDDESPIGRLLELIEMTLRRLETCMNYLDQKELFSGDDELMACKR